MAFKIWIMLFAVSAASCLVIAVPVASETVSQEADVVIEGQVVHEKLVSDGACLHSKTESSSADGSSSTVFRDSANGLMVVSMSNETNKCFVKEMSQAEKDEAKKCKDGAVERNNDKPDLEEEDLDEQPLESSDSVSQEVKDLCGDKEIVKLVPAASSSDNGDGAGLHRKKRGCYYRLRCYYYRRCYTICKWYGCYKRCYGLYVSCKRYLYC